MPKDYFKKLYIFFTKHIFYPFSNIVSTLVDFLNPSSNSLIYKNLLHFL